MSSVNLQFPEFCLIPSELLPDSQSWPLSATILGLLRSLASTFMSPKIFLASG